MMLEKSLIVFFFFKQKTAYEITYGDWSSDVCSSDLVSHLQMLPRAPGRRKRERDRSSIIIDIKNGNAIRFSSLPATAICAFSAVARSGVFRLYRCVLCLFSQTDNLHK